MLNNLLLGQTAEEKLYVEDVFQTYLYSGTGSSQTITTGVDLSANSGMVWIKGRSGATDHAIYDTARGVQKDLVTNATSAETTQSTGLTAFSSTGFTIGALAKLNTSAATYASWTFRKAPKFFDVVTFTGTSSSNQRIQHSLGVVPGLIIVKITSATSHWYVWHRSLSNATDSYVHLNTTQAAATTSGRWGSSGPTATDFGIDSANYIGDGATAVAYLFAHDTTADGVIQCGSFTSASLQTIDLGWEPQFVIVKRSNSTGPWYMFDNMRGMSQTEDKYLQANTSSAEASFVTLLRPTATGFTWDGTYGGDTGGGYIYLAIRRGPMRVPTDATKVFMPTVYTGTNVDNRLVDTTIAPDAVFIRQRTDTVLGGMVVGDRLRGQPYLLTGTTAAEVTAADALDQQIVSTTEYGNAFSSMNGFWCGNNATSKLNTNTTSNNHIVEAFKRAPGFFDIVCYIGTGVARTIDHNLAAVPELILVKRRDTAIDWVVQSAYLPSETDYFLVVNSNSAQFNSANAWSLPTSSTFGIGASSANGTGFNASGGSYVAYLFASCPGVSKVGSYTGNGSSQNIDCGFTNGARFVLIKRTDSTGDWYVWDTSRGIETASDPFLRLNSTAAEVTTNDSIDPLNAGFTVNQNTTTNINVSSATYIYLAIA